MSENSVPKNVKDDEIDLLDLFRRMGNGIAKMSRSIGRGILISIVFMVRRWLPLSLSILAGIGAAYLLKFVSPSFYTSDLVLRSNTMPASDLISQVNRLHTYCLEQNTAELSQSVGLNVDQLKNIRDISAYWIIDQGRDGIPDMVDIKNRHDVYDTINIRMQDRLNIRVSIQAPQELALLKNGIISFINSDSLFQQRNRLKIRQNQELLARLSYDIEQLDSLQKVKYFEETRSRQPQGGGQMIFLHEQNTQLVYPELHNLYSQKQAIDRDNILYRDMVTVLSEFSIPALRINGGGYYAIRTVPILFSVTLLLLIMIANKEKLKEIFNNY